MLLLIMEQQHLLHKKVETVEHLLLHLRCKLLHNLRVAQQQSILLLHLQSKQVSLQYQDLFHINGIDQLTMDLHMHKLLVQQAIHYHLLRWDICPTISIRLNYEDLHPLIMQVTHL